MDCCKKPGGVLPELHFLLKFAGYKELFLSFVNRMTSKEMLKEHVAKTATLTGEQYDHFFSRFRPRSCKKGETIIAVGDKVSDEYFVVKGCLKSFFINEDLKMFILQFAMPTWWASDYNALYNNTRATINVDCITDAEVLCLSAADREELCKDIHQVERFFRWRTNRGYLASQKRLLSFMNKDAKTRYEELMEQYPQLYNLVPKHLIAAYLGVSRETLSRLYQS
jgi:CRP-like cAMP-binding protein